MLKLIPLANITALPNYRTIDVDNGEFKDLTASIKKDGVLQAGLVRPNAKKKDHYELIFGNRRFLAAAAAGVTDFPATVKDVADDDVLEFQIMENLQRKDVHPMDEAAGFKAYQAKKKCDVKELAAVFAKTERYITNRLALNDLIQEVQKDFLKDLLTVGQAEIFAKLPAKEQKQFKQDTYSSYNKKYQYTAAEMKEKVQKNILLKLDAAPWKRDDETLVPAAGSCNNCKKRTSCNALLFADMVKDDRCLDADCYKNKGNAFFVKEVELIATSKPEIKFYTGYDKAVDKDVKKVATQYNIPLISSGDDGVSSYSVSGGKPTKCFAVAGYDKGKYVTVWIRGNSKASAKASKGSTGVAAVKEQTAAIQQRLDRGKELDYEKVQELVINSFRETFPKDQLLTAPIDKAVFNSFALYLVFMHIDYTGRDLFKLLGLEDKYSYRKDPHVLIQKLDALDDIGKSTLLKAAIYCVCSSKKQESPETFIIRQLANFMGIPVHQFVEEQNAIAAKRELNAQKKITALQAKAAPAKEVKAKADTTASKKTTPIKKKTAAPVKKVAAAAKKVAPTAKKVAGLKKKIAKKAIAKSKKKAA